VSILRAPGIYAADRLPLERLRQGTPALAPQDDVYTNHIHADDLAHLALLALLRGRSGRAYNASDDTHMKMGEYFDLVADAFGLPRAPRLPRAELEQAVSPMLLSFMSESRRLDNRRIRRELKARLRHPRVEEAVREMARAK
jgi:nucleoside-diphosphate-sugar epimerase